MIAIVGLTLLILAVVAFRAYGIYKIDPERLARLKSYDTVILDIPKEWQTPSALPSDEVVAFQRKLDEEIRQLTDQFIDELFITSQSLFMKTRRNDALTSADQQILDSFMTSFAPILEETSASLSLPNYTADLTLYSTGTRLLNMQTFAKFTSIAALETARRGDCKTAMEIAALPIRYTAHEDPANLLFWLIRGACVHISTGTFNALAEQCDDPAVLRHGLGIMSELRPDVQPGSAELWSIADQVSVLNRAKGFGYPVDLSPQTKVSLIEQTNEIYGRPFNEWLVTNLPETDLRHQVAREKLANWKQAGGNQYFSGPTSQKIAKVIVRTLTGVSYTAIKADSAFPNIEEAYIRANIVAAVYDLTRLHLAQRILELQSARQTTTPADGSTTATSTITELISSIPLDPFSSGTLLFDNEANRFYSVGPDKNDDGAKVLYDATNGTVSDGDIYFHP